MKKRNSNYSRAFTLVEMLVVIAIIGILAVILVPAVGRAKLKGTIAVTGVQIKELENAIKMYKSDYSRFPAPQGYSRNAAGDFSVGDYDRWDNIYNYSNNDVMKILMADATGANENHKRNPKKRVFINLNPHAEPDPVPEPGLSQSGIYRDPFGNQFNISMDLNGDGFCADSLYSNKLVVKDSWKRVGMSYMIVEGNYDALANPIKNKCFRGGRRIKAGVLGSYDYVAPGSLAGINPLWYARKSEVMVWTNGPDGMASPTCPVFGNIGDKDYDGDGESDLVNDDNILGWK